MCFSKKTKTIHKQTTVIFASHIKTMKYSIQGILQHIHTYICLYNY